ncbi:MAG: Prophage integrase IntA [Steroidobacteraceae bacterium]|nr:Prophage integrase IntA [Steroidobacteraceae bacterium]
MPRQINKLTDVACKNARQGKHFDGGGLYLHVQDSGSKYWRLKYRFAGKERLLAIGVYPDVRIVDARSARHEARALLRDGRDPIAVKIDQETALRQAEKAPFPVVAAAWLEHQRKGWAEETYRKAKYVIDEYLTPQLKKQSIATLTTKTCADALAVICSHAPSLGTKARQYLGSIVDFAIREELREDGRLLSLRGVLPKYEKGHIPAATEPLALSKVIKAVDSYPTPVTRAALTFAMLTAQRPGLIASAEWSEIDLDAAEWSIAGPKMKMRRPHKVPLPIQATELLRESLAWTQGKRYVFPPLARQKSPHLHRDTLSKALREMGFQGKHATHGFRTALRTIARERLGVDPDVLEAQLAHAKKGDVQKAYDRTEFNDVRRRVMQAWADYLDELRAEPKTSELKRAAA